MLDSTSKVVLKFLISNDEAQTNLTISNALKIDPDIVEKSLSSLLEINCIKVSYKDLLYTSYELTNKGRFFFKSNHNDKFYKYWYPIITAFISFVLSLASSIVLYLLSK